MAANVLNRINRLSAERTELYRRAGNGRLSGSALRRRIDELDGELEALWEQRRRERAGRLEGIDLLLHRAYESLYGKDFDMIPIPVSGEGEPTARQAA